MRKRTKEKESKRAKKKETKGKHPKKKKLKRKMKMMIPGGTGKALMPGLRIPQGVLQLSPLWR